ncbi:MULTISPECIES: glycoside hydrolase family 6 protein [Microbacterium]|uniref:glycoside hydrolase family 6 protein n=1 Tax=Microbacterium TaxID=33882 RepID=UPI000ADE9247|nr:MULTISPECIES: glycoside hydrolase family 6 protein [unclassified Microbacterium]
MSTPPHDGSDASDPIDAPDAAHPTPIVRAPKPPRHPASHPARRLQEAAGSAPAAESAPADALSASADAATNEDARRIVANRDAYVLRVDTAAVPVTGPAVDDSASSRSGDAAESSPEHALVSDAAAPDAPAPNAAAPNASSVNASASHAPAAAPRGRRAPRRSRAPRAPRTRRQKWIRGLIIAAFALVVVVVLSGLAIAGIAVNTLVNTVSAQPPRVGTTIVAPDESKAAKAAAAETPGSAEQAAAAYLAAQPTAYWLTPEQDPIGEVYDRVAHLATEARAQKASLAVVVYGLPGRDCGNHSAGGLDEADYVTWTTQIGQALAAASDLRKIVILEPDSLALAPQCGNLSDRDTQLRGAVDVIAGTNTWIYLDGGHSSWLPAAQMADLIKSVGVLDKVRGFATNVSNFNTTQNEFSYAHAVAAALGTGHAIVDTSRNGAGPTSDNQWCNPAGRLVGDKGGTYGDDVVDTNLWIKPPGESDGTCNGGPDAGVWWPAGAVALTQGLVK